MVSSCHGARCCCFARSVFTGCPAVGRRLFKKHHILVVHDLAYADIVYDGYRAPSIM